MPSGDAWPATLAQRHALGVRPANARDLSTDRSRFRMAAATGSGLFKARWRICSMPILRLTEKDTLYRCLDKVLAHKDDLISFLRARWGELFGVTFDVLLTDLTSTTFESDTMRGEEDLRQYGYSRDKRGDCRQVVIGLIVTPEGFPLSYEVLAGNTADSATLGDLLTRIETRYGKANRIWCRD